MIYNLVTATLSKYGRYQLHWSYCVMTVCNNDDTDTNDTVEGRHLVGNVNTVRSSGTCSSHPVSAGSAVWELWDQAADVDMTLLQLRGGLKQTHSSSSSTLERSSSCGGCSNNSPGNCAVSRHVTWSLCSLATITGTLDTGWPPIVSIVQGVSFIVSAKQ